MFGQIGGDPQAPPLLVAARQNAALDVLDVSPLLFSVSLERIIA
jgi:hypothetical protein